MLSRDDVEWLCHHPDAVADAEPLEFSKASEFADGATLRSVYGERGRVLAEFMVARRAARGVREIDAKVPGDVRSEWLVDSESVQQATPVAIARYRAQRLALSPSLQAGALVHDVTCSIGSELAALARRGLTAIGSDIDRGRVAMARHNMEVLENVASTGRDHKSRSVRGSDGGSVRRFVRPLIVHADALCPVTRPAVVIADPARRVQGRRISHPADFIPPLPGLIDVWRRLPLGDRQVATTLGSGRDGMEGSCPELVIKCAPGIDYSGWDGEVEIISVAGAVKEACLWTPGIAAATRGIRAQVCSHDGDTSQTDTRRDTHCADHSLERRVTRRATLIRADGSVDMFTDRDPAIPENMVSAGMDVDARNDRSCDGGVCDTTVFSRHVSGRMGQYIVDPDGAIVRAGLVRQAAYRWGMWQIDPHIAFLTGDTPPAGVLACEVIDSVPLSKVTRAMADRAPDTIEVLVRGVAVNPDHIRAKIMSAARKRRGKASRGRQGSAAGPEKSAQGCGGLVSGGTQSGEYTLVITQVGERNGHSSAVAFICGPRVVGASTTS
ncbi:hypothetical protein ACGE24_00940 [Corynebacterium kroppenstedtii]|uniref:hypothetical protein n=1 Tax=Corynebacterium sp. PCR 32 TaxID=3351342 RepID=UPI00309DB56B